VSNWLSSIFKERTLETPMSSSGDEEWIGEGFKLVPFLHVDWWVAYKRGMAVRLENVGSEGHRAYLEDVRGGPACPVAWGPDARTLFTSRGDEVVAIDSVDGSVRVIAPARAVWTIATTPDGSTLFFQRDPGHVLTSVSIMTGSTATLMPNVWSVAFDWSDRVAYVLQNVPRGRATIWRVGLDDSEPTKLAELETGGRISLSHDHRLLAIGDWTIPSEIRTVDVQTGEIQTVGLGYEPMWSPVRRALAFGNGAFGDERVSIRDEAGTVLPLFAAPGEADPEFRDAGWGGRPSWSPDGRLLALTACRARFDHDAFARDDPSNPYRHLHSWKYERKRAVFDLERREVVVREGHWSDVAWQPRGA
jgi:hypothetical protein